MDDRLGTLLPPRHTIAWGALLVAAVFLVTPVLVLKSGRDGEIDQGPAALLAALVALLFVAMPLWAAARLFRQRIFVGDDRVTLCLGDRVTRQLPYADLSEVRAIVDGSLGSITPEIWNKAVLLFGQTPSGTHTGIKVTRQQVTSIDPLLRALRPVVAARPELVKDETSRQLLLEFTGEATA